MNHTTEQHQNPAQASSKARVNGEQPTSKDQMQQQALENAVTGQSVANFQAIFEGFEAMGIPADAIKPRVNVFTFNAWKALGRSVKRGEHGVKIVTVIPCTKKDPATGEAVPVKKIKTTTVFHISQTQALDDTPDDEPTDKISDTRPTPAAPVIEDTNRPAPAVESAEARPLNAYELKLEARRERYEDRAASASQASDATYQKARDMASVIPFGQPILVGHHSERRDRNYRDKIHTTFGKSFALQDKANHYARKAETVGTGGISSDDPDAVTKLTEKLAGLERSQERMKAANKIIRSKQATEGKILALVALGFSETGAAQVLEKDFAGRVGFPAYALSNNNAVIRSTQQRIKQLAANQQRATVERKGNGYTYREDTEENRVMFVFDTKPGTDARKHISLVMQAHGFKWSSTRAAWVRKLNNAAVWGAERVAQKLDALPLA